MTVAEELSELVRGAVGVELPVRLRAWDGSEAGDDDAAPILHVKDKNALRRLLWSPGELALAQAYVTGEIDVAGDLAEGLRRMFASAEQAQASPGVRARLSALPFALRHKIFGPKPAAPDLQASLSGRLHSRSRDREAVSHHYDLSNDFYAALLDERMVYSCGYWTGEGPEYGLAEAQRDKLDLICRKLELREGMRLLDVGCGWGALGIYAAAHYGVEVVGVTLSRQQHAFAAARVAEAGLRQRVDFRLSDFRDVDGGPYDAVSSIEMGEHVGRRGYPEFAARLRRLLAPGGKLLLQQMSRGAESPGGGPFIETYIAPDMHMRPVGQTVDLLEHAGLEVRDVEAMREHYVRTVQAWHDTLEKDWEEFADRYGEPLARVWRLYLAGGALAFAEGRMGVDQIMAVNPLPYSGQTSPPVRTPFAAAKGA